MEGSIAIAGTAIELADVALSEGAELEIRQRATAAIGADNVTQSAVAKELGVSPAALSQWLKGKYAGDVAALDRKVEQWLSLRERRQQAAGQLPAPPKWFEGPSARDILAALAIAHLTGDMVCVYGGPGVGKTKSCEHYRDDSPAVWLATMAPHCTSVVPALQEIAEAVGIKDMSFTGARPLYRAILKRLEGTDGLLIIDEAQHLGEKCLDQIRSIHDASGIGIALVGNESVYTRLTGGNRAVSQAQLFSRIGARKYVARPAAEDVRAQASAWGIGSADIIDYLIAIAAKPGALRAVTKSIRLASMQAGSIEAVTLEHIKRAWANLGAER